jgi:hypothetical protein
MKFDAIGPTSDGTWESVDLGIYSIAEGGVYLICCCLPAYRTLYVKIRRQKTGTIGLSSYTGKKWERNGSRDVDNGGIPLSASYIKAGKHVPRSKFERTEDHELGYADSSTISVRQDYTVESWEATQK